MYSVGDIVNTSLGIGCIMRLPTNDDYRYAVAVPRRDHTFNTCDSRYLTLLLSMQLYIVWFQPSQTKYWYIYHEIKF